MAVAGAVHRGGCFGVGTCQWGHRAVRVADSVAAVAAGRRRPGPGRRGSPAAGQHKRCGRRGAAESARRASWELGTDHSHKILFFGACSRERDLHHNPWHLHLVKSLRTKMRFHIIAGAAVGGLSLVAAAVYFNSRSRTTHGPEIVLDQPKVLQATPVCFIWMVCIL